MIIEIKPLVKPIEKSSFFINGHYLAKYKSGNTFVCDAMDLLKHELKSASGDVLSLPWQKAIKEIKKNTAYSEYTLKQEGVVLLNDIYEALGSFELIFIEEGKIRVADHSEKFRIKDIDAGFLVKINSIIVVY